MTEDECTEKSIQFAKGTMELAFRIGYATRDSEIVKCKDCARNDNCFMYRESGNDEGYCAWADRRKE